MADAERPTFTFWGETHGTQASALRSLRAFVDPLPMRVAYVPGDTVFKTILAPLSYHGEWSHLLRSIAKFRFIPEDGGGRAMEVRLVTGELRRLSWTKSFEPRTIWSLYMKTFREEVADQTAAYAAPFRKMKNPVSELPGDPQPLYVKGKWVGHVDHIDPKFREIVRHFIYEMEGFPDLAPLPEGGRRIKDKNIRRMWRSAHAYEAKLRVITREQNLALEEDSLDEREQAERSFFGIGAKDLAF